MRPILPTALILVCLSACMPPAYRPPKANEPHAIVKIRSTIHRRYKTNLSQDIYLNEWSIDRRVYGAEQGADASTVHLRVRPEPTWWQIHTTYSHQVHQAVMRPYTVTEQQPCGTYTTGTGTHQMTHTQYCTHHRTEHRMVTESQTVIDASCKGKTYMTPRPGAVYLVQYDFYGDDDCRMTCFQQLPLPDGQFQLVSCPQ